MGFQFRKSFKIAPGMRVNLGKKGVGMSFGAKGARVSVNSSGRKSASVGIPGTGMSYTKSLNSKKASSSKRRSASSPQGSAYKQPKKGLSTGAVILLVIFYPIGICYFLVWLIRKILASQKSKTSSEGVNPIEETVFQKKDVVSAISSPTTDVAPMEVFVFPDYDATNHRRLALTQVALSGITHSHFGFNPQDILPGLQLGEQVLLHADTENEYDPSAVWVSDHSGAFIGWIPSGSNAELFNHLLEGRTVLARVENTYLIGIDEDNMSKDELLSAPTGCIISIARYAKNVTKFVDSE